MQRKNGRPEPVSRSRRDLLQRGILSSGVLACSGTLASLGWLMPAGSRNAHAQQQPGSQPATSAPGETRDWRSLSQQELDAAYSQDVWAPNMQDVLARYAANSERTRARLGEPLRFSYGEAPLETLDVYRATAGNAPIQLFVHGGGWAAGSAREHGFLAEPFVDAGAHFIAADFASVRDTGGDLKPLVDQLRRAVGWIHEHAAEIGGDASRLYVSGHSSGGHLAGVLLTTDWRAFDLPADVIRGGLICSGMFDLEPVSVSSRREYLSFDATVIETLSPQRNLAQLNAPVLVAHGTRESPEFQRQSREFVDAVRAAGKPAELLVGELYNHFEILETLANPYGLLGRAALVQMGLA